MDIRRSLRKARHTAALQRDTALPQITFPYSKGWAFQAESNGGQDFALQTTEKVLSPGKFARLYQKNAASYWLRMGSGDFPHLDHFVERILPYQEQPFIVISSDGDLTVPNDANPASVEKLLSHPKLICWYSQNADIQPAHNGKLRPIPIGLDLHSPRPAGTGSALYAQFKAIADRAPAMEDRSDKIFVDIHLNFTADLRQVVSERLKGNPNYAFLPGRVPQTELWETYTRHKHVLSIVGHGYDCHRTWEALGLGCRVVTLTSPIDPFLETQPIYVAPDLDTLAKPDLLDDLARYFAGPAAGSGPGSGADTRALTFGDFL